MQLVIGTHRVSAIFHSTTRHLCLFVYPLRYLFAAFKS